MMKYVAGFLFSEDKKHVLLIQKTKPEWQKGQLNGVGGKIEDGETSMDAMIREFREEANLEIRSWDHVISLVGVKGGEETYRVDFFCAFDDRIYSAVALTEETLHVTNTFGLPKNVIFNLRWLIPMCLDGNIEKPTKILDIQGN